MNRFILMKREYGMHEGGLGMGIGDWGLGQSPITIPNPHE